MSSWKFEIELDGSWVDLTNYGGRSLVTREGIELERQAHNRGRSVVSSLRFTMEGVPTALIADLFQIPTYELIPIRVERDGSRYFTGYVRPVDVSRARASSAIERTVDAEAVDVLWRTHRSLKSDVRFDDVTVDYVLRQLLSEADVPSAMIAFGNVLTASLPFFEASEGDEISSLIDDLLWEYHHVVYGTTDGQIDLFDWRDNGSTPVATIDESIDEVSVEKTDDDYGYIRVRYFTYTNNDAFFQDQYQFHRSNIGDWGGRSSNGLSFSDGIKLSDPSLGDEFDIIRRKNLRIAWEHSRIVAGPQNFDTAKHGSGDGLRLYVGDYGGALSSRYRWYLSINSTSSVTGNFNADYVTANVTFGNYRLIGYSVSSATGTTFDEKDTDYLIEDVQIKVVGELDYRERSEEIKAAITGVGNAEARTETIDSEYLYAASDARDFAEAVLQVRQYGSKQWRVKSSTYIPVRSIVNMNMASLGLSSRARVLRVLDSQRNATDDGNQEYVYVIESLAAVSITDNSTPEGIPSAPAVPPPSPGPTFGDLENGVDESGPVTELLPPTIATSSTLRAAAISISHPQSITSPSLRYQLQISDNSTALTDPSAVTWFSLGPGGNGADDWKDTADEVTTVYQPGHTHESLPLNGTASNPLAATYYYRARITTGALVSGWSDAVAVSIGAAGEQDIAADAITANKIAVNAVTAAKIDVSDLFAQEITIGSGGSINAANGSWGFNENSAAFAGWEVQPQWIRDAADSVRLRTDQPRLEIRDTLGVIKQAHGYLGGITADDGTAFDTSTYGDYYGPGSRVLMESGADYVSGAYNVNADAAFVVKTETGDDIEAVRLGSLGAGDIGLDIGGMSFEATVQGGGGASGTFEATVRGGGGATGTFENWVRGGGGARYGTKSGLLYSLADDRLYLTGTLVGVDGEFSGTVSAGAIIGGTIEGTTITGTRIEGAEIIGGSITGITIEGIDLSGTTISGADIDGGTIDIGGGDFTVDSSGNVNAANIDITGGFIDGDIELAPSGRLFATAVPTNVHNTGTADAEFGVYNVKFYDVSSTPSSLNEKRTDLRADGLEIYSRYLFRSNPSGPVNHNTSWKIHADSGGLKATVTYFDGSTGTYYLASIT